MREKRGTLYLTVAGLLIALAATSPPARATVTTFTSRAAWEAAVNGEVTDSFESAVDGVYPTPYALSGGLLLTSPAPTPVDIQILGSGILGSRELHIRDFASGVRFALSSSGNAFGFDYHASEDWVLTANGRSVTLRPPASGFIGFVDNTAPITSFSLRGAAGPQGGISIDNLSQIGTSFAGVAHRALGEARLSRDAAGNLVVSNLGLSGDDGVAIDVGKSGGWDGYFAPVNLPNTGSAQEISFIGSRPGSPSQVGAVIRTENIGGGQKEIEIGFRRNSTASLDAYLNGNLVYHKENIQAVAAQDSKFLPFLGWVVAIYVLDHTDAHLDYSQKDGWSGGVSWNHPTSVKVSGGPQILTDLIKVTPRLDPGFDVLERVEIRGQGLPSFTVVKERVVLNHVPYGVLGNATFTPAADKLTVGNIGSTGTEGVTVDLGKAGPVDFSLEPIDPAGDAPAGSFLEISTVGSIAGVPGRTLGRLRTTKTSNAFATTADFSAFNAPTHRVQVFREGALVADLHNQAASLPIFSSRWWDKWYRRHCWPLPCEEPWFPFDTTFQVDGNSYVGDRLLISPEVSSPPAIDHQSSATFRASGIPQLTLANATVTATGCVPGPTALCLNEGRFKVETAWKIANGGSGVGHAIPLTGDTGYFWFFDSSNVEMVLKVLNGCTTNRRFWVFAGGLTDVEVTTTVTDMTTGAMKTYKNNQGTDFKPILDTDAFSICSAAADRTEDSDVLFGSNGEDLLASSAEEDTSLLLNNNRFRVDVEWQTADGHTGVGQAVPLTGDTGYFWFFDSFNVEMVIKVLNACNLNNRYWVFTGGLTNVKVRILVTDTLRGTSKEYNNPQGRAFQPLLDTSAFATCP